jgi:hypothetical protein
MHLVDTVGSGNEKEIICLEVRYCKCKCVNVCRNFTEGWVEFLSKKVARRVADQLNNTQGKNQHPASQFCGAGADIKLSSVAGAEIKLPSVVGTEIKLPSVAGAEIKNCGSGPFLFTTDLQKFYGGKKQFF